MSETEQTLVLVTPVWNDSTRLAGFGPGLAEALVRSGLPVRWIVADDGSSAEEKEQVTKLIETFREIYPRVEAMLFDDRSHKGGAIYGAWDACPEAAWLAFVDADGAVDAPSMVRLMKEAVENGLKCGCVGVRRNSEQTPLRRPLGRLLSFYIFTSLVHCLTGVRYEDTQCGAKVIPAEGYRRVSKNLKERGFVFDVELLLALELAGYTLRELPIPWHEMPGGKVNPLRDAWGMIGGLLRIRRRYKSA